MARRAKIGQAPRAAQSLTATIIAIAREMQNQEAQNLMDAWQKGGSWEGKKATDEEVLKYWNGRLKDIATTDPNYDTYKNTVYQLDYTIHESKVQTAYAQGKMTEGQVASFYLGWANKVPRDSEFYRVLQRDAAQFTRAAAAKSKAAVAQAQEKAYQDGQLSTYNRHEATGNYLQGILTKYAQTKGALIGADGNISNFDPSDPQAIINFINSISNTPGVTNKREGGNVPGGVAGVLYHDPLTGKAVTGQQVLDTLHKMDPHFNGQLTLGYVTGALTDQMRGQTIRLERATKTGHSTDVNRIMGDQRSTSEFARETKAWPAVAAYEAARTIFLQTWGNKANPPEVMLAAHDQYVKDLTAIADKYPALDDNTRTRIMNEATGVSSTTTLAEDPFGLANQDNTTTGIGHKGDTAETQFDVNRYANMKAAVDAGAAYWTTGTTDSNGIFHAGGGGTEIGASQDKQPPNSQIVYVPQGGNMPMLPLLVPTRPVYAKIVDENGNSIGSTPNQAQVGLSTDVPINGVMTRLYGFKTTDGETRWTQDAPWAKGVTEDDSGKDSIVLTYAVTKPDPNTIADGDPTWHIKTKPDGTQVIDGVNPGTIVFDPARNAAGPDPATDFPSPTIAANSQNPDARVAMYQQSKDDAFIHQINLDNATNTGGIDAQGQPVNPTAYASANAVANIAMTTPEQAAGQASAISDILHAVPGLWNRVTTAKIASASPQSQANPQNPQGAGFGPLGVNVGGAAIGAPVAPAPLPSDQVKDTPFQTLGAVFQPFVNAFKTEFGIPDQQTVSGPNQIKVPTVKGAYNPPNPAVTEPKVPSSSYIPVNPAQKPLPGSNPGQGNQRAI